MPTLLVRYGELALKSPPVRREFERTLQRNIMDQFLHAGSSCRLRADHGHLYVETDDSSEALRLVRRVFGVTSVSPVEEVPTELEGIRSRVISWAEPLLTPKSSFAIRARRTGSHSFTSQELARDLGARVMAQWPERALSVDLDSPDVELFVEVRGPRTYLYSNRVQGPGGFPLGVAGRVVALVDGRRGAVGAFLMMKRGCRVVLVAAGAGEELVGSTLTRFDPMARVTRTREEAAPETMRSLIQETRADGVVLPLQVDEFPSARQAWGETVLFSPTLAFTDEEVDIRWQEITALAG
ncbi:MAG: THUMP domain-containing protein [Thermoplasmata archaeon]|nr:THUMP domain-containing protein [Thermoplasmata archaeon]